MTDRSQLPDIRQYTIQDLQTKMKEWGEAPFRGKQIYEWLWKKGARDFDTMSNLSKSLRDQLQAHFRINPVEVLQEFQSKDGTVKLGFQLHDGHLVEGVLIPSDGRYTACISSQVGCSLSCKFCATGTIDLKRNIRADEIFDQAYLINEACKRIYGCPLTNIVYMGMGEPLLNFREVTNSIRRITSDQGMGLSPKRITVSTVGIAKMIKKLADEQLRVNFALSLHVANEEKRQQVMPITMSNTIPDLKEAVQYFYDQTGIAVTYEYTLLRGFNDNIADARELAAFCKTTPCKINLIEYNPVDTSQFNRSEEDKAEAFMAHLAKKGLTVSLRRSRGEDIDAACGQLANKNEPASA
jgi:23S rRNA (adenine2503-C2)-methyltransferase